MEKDMVIRLIKKVQFAGAIEIEHFEALQEGIKAIEEREKLLKEIEGYKEIIKIESGIKKVLGEQLTTLKEAIRAIKLPRKPDMSKWTDGHGKGSDSYYIELGESQAITLCEQALKEVREAAK